MYKLFERSVPAKHPQAYTDFKNAYHLAVRASESGASSNVQKYCNGVAMTAGLCPLGTPAIRQHRSRCIVLL
jgi:hypothetical protein